MDLHSLAAWMLLLLPFVFVAALIFAGHHYSAERQSAETEANAVRPVAASKADAAAPDYVGLMIAVPVGPTQQVELNRKEYGAGDGPIAAFGGVEVKKHSGELTPADISRPVRPFAPAAVSGQAG